MEEQGKEWDAFVSHAVEDQESFVRHLSRMLTRLGLSVWYAETALRVGDSLSASISRGLACSRYGIVVISQHFITKRWTNWELAGLVNRQNSEEKNVILPVWHGVSKTAVMDFSPPLADLIALNTATEEADEIAFKLLRRIRPDIYGRRQSIVEHTRGVCQHSPGKTFVQPALDIRAFVLTNALATPVRCPGLCAGSVPNLVRPAAVAEQKCAADCRSTVALGGHSQMPTQELMNSVQERLKTAYSAFRDTGEFKKWSIAMYRCVWHRK